MPLWRTCGSPICEARWQSAGQTLLISPLEATIGAQALARYEAALARLPAPERELVIARIELGRAYADIAEEFGKPSANAARMAVARAIVRLAEEMRRGG